jgi:MATE family multidrug resistance protein
LLLATGPLGNHGLWLAFSLFLLVRAVGQAMLMPRLERTTFA